VRAGLGLSDAAFVDFALLLGTDFSQRIAQVGPNRALRFIRLYGSVESILESVTQYAPPVPADYLVQISTARGVFAELPPLPDPRILSQGPYREKEVFEIMLRHRLQRLITQDGWDPSAALAGNYFDDNPHVDAF